MADAPTNKPSKNVGRKSFAAAKTESASFAKDVLEPLSWVAASFGILLGVWQLIIAHYDRQVDASLNFAQRFSDDEDAGKYRRYLDMLWRAEPEKVMRQRAGIL